VSGPIVGLSAERTDEVLAEARAAVAEGASTIAEVTAALGQDEGVVTAALLRLRDAGDVVLDRQTRTFRVED